MISSQKVKLMYLYLISGEIGIHVIITSDNNLLVVLTIIDTKFGPNMSSSTMILSLVTEQFIRCLPLIILT